MQRLLILFYAKEVDLSIFKRDYKGAGIECCKLTENLLKDFDKKIYSFRGRMK